MTRYAVLLPFALLLVGAGPESAEAPAVAEPEVAPQPIRWTPENPAPGDIFLVHIEGVGENANVSFGDRNFAVWTRPDGASQAAFAALPHTGKAGDTVLVLTRKENGKKVTLKATIPVAKKKFDESKLSVDKKFTKLSKKTKRRVKAERKEINRAFRDVSPKPLWDGPFAYPMKTEVTGVYGTRRVFNGKVKSVHRGLDLDGKRGDPIKASNKGRVVLADDLYYTGKCVFIDHGLGLFSVYFHMSKLLVKEGDMVERGQLIGKVGATGRVTGPHLHLGYKLSGMYVDPVSLLELTEPLKVGP